MTTDRPAGGSTRCTRSPTRPASPRPGSADWSHEALDRAGDFADPLPDRGPPTVRARRPHHRLRRHPPARRRWPRPNRPAAAWPSTSCSGCSWPWSCAPAAPRGRPGHPPRHRPRPTAGPRWSSSSSAACPFPPTGAQGRAIADIARRPGRPAAHAPAPPGRRRLRQDGGGGGRTAGRCRGRPPGGAHGADRGAGRAARHRGPPARRRARGARPVDPRRASARCGWPCSPAGPAPPSGPRSTPDWPTARSTSWSAPTRCSPTRSAFRSLGVVVIDEQHRFGVEQRAALRDKGRGDDGTGDDPDLLVMTATPIPRTAAMVVFGDLDMTVIDELPPGRQPVTTVVAAHPARGRTGLGRGCATRWPPGHRAFVVCPLVEGSDRVEAASATAEAERLAGGRAGRAAGRPPARPDAAGREGAGHGRVPDRRARRAGGHHGDRGRRRRPRGHGHGHRGRRPVRHRPAPPAAGPGGTGRRAGLVLPAVGVRRSRGRPPACRPWSGPTTGSSWPRSTSSCGARGPSSAPARRDAATSSWPGSCPTGTWWSTPGHWPRSWWPRTRDLADHRLLVEELRLFVDDDEAEFLFKS